MQIVSFLEMALTGKVYRECDAKAKRLEERSKEQKQSNVMAIVEKEEKAALDSDE